MSKAFENLLNAVNKAKSSGASKREDDGKFWQAERDKAGNGFAVIRFLPGKTDDDIPFVKLFNHGFKNSQGKWFVENCPTTIGEDCPVCNLNGRLVDSFGGWNETPKESKEIIRSRKRKLSYYSNVLIISDPKHPENEGKVFIFRYGQKIYDKIIDKIQPVIMEGETPSDPINVFDLNEGCNFKLKIRDVDDFANFDKSEWESPSVVKNQDEILAQMHDIAYIEAKTNFKSYADIEKALNRVVGEVLPEPEFEDKVPERKEEKKSEAVSKPSPAPAKESAETDADEEDDDMAFFRNLANGD